jgi:hypothetical protein
MKRALSLSPSLALALLAAACATSAPPATAPAPPPAPAMETAPAPRLPGALHWMRDAAEYRALLIQTYGAAGDRLEEIVGGLPPGTWAVSLDGDETVIDNSQYLKERALQGAGFTAESWAEWTTRQAAPPLPGALDFLHRVRELGGRIAIVTNRRASQCPDTEENFRKHEIPFDVILCAPDQGSTEKAEPGALRRSRARAVGVGCGRCSNSPFGLRQVALRPRSTPTARARTVRNAMKKILAVSTLILTSTAAAGAQATAPRPEVDEVTAGASPGWRWPASTRSTRTRSPTCCSPTRTSSRRGSSPRSFYGCFDWHSAVHGHWLLARLARTFPEAPFAPRRRRAGRSLTPENGWPPR